MRAHSPEDPAEALDLELWLSRRPCSQRLSRLQAQLEAQVGALALLLTSQQRWQSAALHSQCLAACSRQRC